MTPLAGPTMSTADAQKKKEAEEKEQQERQKEREAAKRQLEREYIERYGINTYLFTNASSAISSAVDAAFAAAERAETEEKKNLAKLDKEETDSGGVYLSNTINAAVAVVAGSGTANPAISSVYPFFQEKDDSCWAASSRTYLKGNGVPDAKIPSEVDLRNSVADAM